MSNWNEEDEKSDDRYDPLADLENIADDATRNIGIKPHRKIYFYCGLHGLQDISHCVWAGIQLNCGCRLRSVSGHWKFSTKEDR